MHGHSQRQFDHFEFTKLSLDDLFLPVKATLHTMYTFSRGNQWSTHEIAPAKNGEPGKFLWSLSLLIRPERYPDSRINTCFSFGAFSD